MYHILTFKEGGAVSIVSLCTSPTYWRQQIHRDVSVVAQDFAFNRSFTVALRSHCTKHLYIGNGQFANVWQFTVYLS